MLTKIVDDAQVKIEFTVPEKYASMIDIGSKQEFSVVSDTKTHMATVTAKASRLDETTRTLLVRAISSNQERQLLTGQSARLKLTIHTENNALMVASQALIPSSQGYSVFVVHGNKAELIQVEIGQRGPYDIQVIKGVSIGDTIITSNLPRLTTGTEVLFATVK
jgi:membrane fusion protein (multidrug efflux system)